MRQRERRKQRTGERESHDRWMITYADLITLLLIFFVVLYAMSSLDAQKYKIVTDSLSQTFTNGNPVIDGGSGILDGGQGGEGGGNAGTGQNGQSGQNSSSGDSNSDNAEGNNTGGGPDSGSGAPAADEEQPPSARELAFREQEAKLAALMDVITRYVADNNLGDEIFVADKPQGIAITLSDQFLFDAGRAELKAPAYPALRQLSGLFSGIGATISIEGHTDNTPVSAGSRYNDNWELSGARALSILRFFIDSEGLDPDNFQYAGYADTRPAADNTTNEGKQKNRRVELIVLRQLQDEEAP
ncbi:flagellar motor protein [Paenibacillus sp. PK3_47]|uniref:flagellar motor protein MotB n=1 Tax=Paenibacillus sp. PK3_47 TaxID=2072642 RepID=UPI00201DFFAC|nr:flagellar motor protein MotB [Paenibacillus sp. PK3_47]UQZ33786.1 flagellar motor protein [Paenibacillus sp. PK3_47]